MRMIIMVCLLLGIAVDTPATSHWTVDPHQFQYDMTVYARLNVVTVDDYEVAAFCGDECRGVAKVLTVDENVSILCIRIRSNVNSDEPIAFRSWKSSTGEEKMLNEQIIFDAQTVLGTPSEPFMLTLGNIMLGDANGDGVIDALDASLILQYVAHKFGDENTDFIRAAADANNSGEIDALDASLVLQHAAKKIDINEIENNGE